MHSSVAMFISGWRLVRNDWLMWLDRLGVVGFGWLGVVGWFWIQRDFLIGVVVRYAG